MDKVNQFNDCQILKEDEVIGFVMNRFFTIKKNNSIKKLISFHTQNKYLLMTHSPSGLNKLGNIVANHDKREFKQVLVDYEKNLIETLQITPTEKRNINVIMHIFGHFSKNFSSNQKQVFLDLVKKYRNLEITLGYLLTEIAMVVHGLNNTYLAEQTYFLLYAEKKQGCVFSLMEKISNGN